MTGLKEQLKSYAPLIILISVSSFFHPKSANSVFRNNVSNFQEHSNIAKFGVFILPVL